MTRKVKSASCHLIVRPGFLRQPWSARLTSLTEKLDAWGSASDISSAGLLLQQGPRSFGVKNHQTGVFIFSREDRHSIRLDFRTRKLTKREVCISTKTKQPNTPFLNHTTMSEDKNDEILSGIPAIGKQCPCFVVFLRLLLKFLQKHGDGKTYETLRRRVQICTEKANRQEPGYECVAKALMQEIPHIVSTSDLRRVQAMLRLRVQQKKARQQAKTGQSSDDSNAYQSPCENFDIFERVSAMKSEQHPLWEKESS